MAPAMHSFLILNFTPQPPAGCGEWQVLSAGLGAEFVLPLFYCF